MLVLRGRPGFGCRAFFVSAFPCASESERALSNMHLNAMFKEVLMLQDWLFVLLFFFMNGLLRRCTMGETGAEPAP